MKNTVKLSLMLTTLALALMLVACDKAPKGDKAVITDQELAKEGSGETFIIDSTTSQVRFTGNGVGKNHPGTFKVTYGTVTVNNDSITGGTFIMDIRSMDLEQEGEMIETKLRPHLLSGDFFDAEKFGTSKFEITKVEPYKPKDNEKSLVEGANYTVSGNLQIKNVTKNISFPARIDLDGNTLKAEANFDIDRRQWQMNYGNDKTLGDKFISETVNIELDVQARKENNTSAQAN